MSKGFDVWDKNMIILGAQAMKCMDFYEVMDNVGYNVDEDHIYDKDSGEIIEREDGYGYGLIIKARNPQMENGTGILLGGYGVLGTEAAIHFFIKNIAKLGKEYGSNCFSLIVRAKTSAGKQSVKRIKKYDKSF